MSKTNVLEIPSLHPHLKGYRIVFEKQKSSPEKEALPKEEKKLFDELYYKVQEEPKKHIDQLLELDARCPRIPEIANLLAFAYLKTSKGKEAEALIEKTWREHPDYLIARINYGEQVLRKGKKEMLPVIFNHCFDLNTLYPDRDSFHYAEFRGFMALMGFYYLKNREKEKAEECYQLAFQVDPLHPSVTALEKELSKVSFPSSLIRNFKHFLYPLLGRSVHESI
ncbi:MAG: hypothetical protein JSS60_05795 [Verrucomicrobia bacterium]|nr:hypothetical protein [Verrucomicrobiota bacterium]